MDLIEYSVVPVICAGKNDGACRAANGTRRIGALKPQAAVRQRINTWSTAKRPPSNRCPLLLISHDVENVGEL